MPYSIFNLKFETGVHTGLSNGGPSLDDGQMTIHSDTLFSALYCEAMKYGQQDQLLSYFKSGTLAISDALPFHKDSYFLPKPLIHVERRAKTESASVKKAMKAISHIALQDFACYVQGLSSGSNPDWLQKPNFGVMSIQTRVSLRNGAQPLPYQVAIWTFSPHSGLYIILRHLEDDALRMFKQMLTALGACGIGGKQSSGLGKFCVEHSPAPEEMLTMLGDESASYQMLLGLSLPQKGQLEAAMAQGWYTLTRRGGYARSHNDGLPFKRNTVYMLSTGACFTQRFQGEVLNLCPPQGTHPVWRCANTLFLGVNI